MSSKTRRSVQHVSFSSSSSSRASRDSSQTEVASGSADMSDISSPLSPTRMSRIQEKEQLMHLNDRLAQYIERVRNLESENQRLSYQIRTTEETVVKERSNIRSAFEHELADARRLLDETAKEKAKLQIDAGKYAAQVDELLGKLTKLEKDTKDNDSRRLYAESQVQDLTGKLNTAENQRKHWEDEAKKFKSECDSQKKQLSNCQRQLEEETLLRVDLENRLQSLREELAFNKQLFEKELDETRKKRQTEITEINTALEQDYRQKLQDALRETRGQFEQQLRANRQEVESMYESKMADMRAMADRNAGDAATAREDARKMRASIESFERDRSRYENQISVLERKIRELEDHLRNEQDNFATRLATRDDEIRRLQHEIAVMIQDYQDLMDTKIQLDVEIEAYRKLLEGEEARLNLTPTEQHNGQHQQETLTPRSGVLQRGTKRKRVLQEREIESEMTYTTSAEQTGDIEVLDHDVEGLYVKLHNKGDQDVSLGGWILKREANGVETSFKFHRTLVLKPQKTVTVWSSNAQVTHSPPAEIKMKTQQWPVGSTIRTSLTNVDGEDVAWRESTRSQHSERHTYRTRDGTGADSAVVGPDGEQKCTIM